MIHGLFLYGRLALNTNFPNVIITIHKVNKAAFPKESQPTAIVRKCNIFHYIHQFVAPEGFSVKEVNEKSHTGSAIGRFYNRLNGL